jgi:hypothetical protein
LQLSRGTIRKAVGACLLVAAIGAVSTAAIATAATNRTAGGWEGRPTLGTQLALARLATTKYASDLGRAKADGYRIITRMIPDMGYHFMNPGVKGFDVRKPPILVYEHHGASWQLAALEWVFPAKPAQPPLAGARYGSFPAACHFADGTFVAAAAQASCAKASPETGAAFTFWHPRLVTMHVWIWYPNPSGLFASMNPLASAYNRG